MDRPKEQQRLQYDEVALRDYLKKGQIAVDQGLDAYLADRHSGNEAERGEKTPSDPALLLEAMRYSVFAGGKRLRPNLCLAAAEAIGGRRTTALPFASAIELVHTYSLVHDDLPAMDNDDLRRGKPTNHKVYGDGMAILVGDALLTAAFTWMAQIGRESPSHQNVLEAIFDLGSSAGLHGMVLGQALDLKIQGRKEMDAPLLEAIHRYKTGALITASVRIGGILGDATDAQLQSLTEYGKKVGLAFQITDDLLDVIGETAELGKSVGQDQINKKWTYPRFVGIQKAKESAYQLAVSASEALDSFGVEADPLRWIAAYTINRKS
jgi:geranylgeranyl diphosphate synthase type II